MPIPFILGGIALAAAGYGVKKGVDAKGDFDTAKSVNQRAQIIYDEATKKLEKSRGRTNLELENLGELKMTIYKNLTTFTKTFSKIKNIDFSHNIAEEIGIPISQASMLDLEASVLRLDETIGGGIAALGAGGLAGLGAYGGVGLLASASTGTAIGTLSGAAATNATLAWLGGGSLAAGGGGMALGTAVLGGIVAGPVLAVGGAMLAAKAETAKHEAYANYDKAEAAVAEMDTACIVLDGILKQTREISSALLELNKVFIPHIKQLKTIVMDESTDYGLYNRDDKQTVMKTAAIAQTLKNLCDAPVLNKEGAVETKSMEIVGKARKLLEEVNL